MDSQTEKQTEKPARKPRTPKAPKAIGAADLKDGKAVTTEKAETAKVPTIVSAGPLAIPDGEDVNVRTHKSGLRYLLERRRDGGANVKVFGFQYSVKAIDALTAHAADSTPEEAASTLAILRRLTMTNALQTSLIKAAQDGRIDALRDSAPMIEQARHGMNAQKPAAPTVNIAVRPLPRLIRG